MGYEWVSKGGQKVLDVGFIEQPPEVAFGYVGMLKALLDRHWPALAEKLSCSAHWYSHWRIG